MNAKMIDQENGKAPPTMSDPEKRTVSLEKLTQAFAGVAAIYLVGIPLTLVSSIVLARTLSVADFGAFGFAISIASILALPVVGGLPGLLMRETSRYMLERDWSAYRGLVMASYGWAALIGGLGLLAALAWILAQQQAEAQILVPLLLVPLMGFIAIATGVLRGLGHPAMAESQIQIVQPILLTLGYMALAKFDLASDTAALWWYLGVTVIVLVFTSRLLIRTQPAQALQAIASRTDMPRWIKSLVPFAIMGATSTLFAQIAVILLGLAGTDEAVAHMRVAERAAQLTLFPLLIAGSVLGPHFVKVLKSNEPGEIKRILRHSARLIFAISLAIAASLLTFGRPLLSLTFGEPYAIGSYGPMSILIGAQTLSAALGPSGILLAMGGHEKLTLYSQIIGLAVIPLVALPMIEIYGATGAAIGSAAGLLTNRVIEFIAVRRTFTVWSSIL